MSVVSLLIFSSDVDCCNQNSVLFPFSAILSRGPTTGLQGKVLLAFEDNVSSKVGVRFDRPIVDGNDLGGLCEKDRGFFCPGNFPSNIYAFASKVYYTNGIRYAATSLRLDSSSSDNADRLAINEIFEVVSFTTTLCCLSI